MTARGEFLNKNITFKLRCNLMRASGYCSKETVELVCTFAMGRACHLVLSLMGLTLVAAVGFVISSRTAQPAIHISCRCSLYPDVESHETAKENE